MIFFGVVMRSYLQEMILQNNLTAQRNASLTFCRKQGKRAGEAGAGRAATAPDRPESRVWTGKLGQQTPTTATVLAQRLNLPIINENLDPDLHSIKETENCKLFQGSPQMTTSVELVFKGLGKQLGSHRIP